MAMLFFLFLLLLTSFSCLSPYVVDSPFLFASPVVGF